MQYELFDDFKDGMVMTAIPLSWFKRVTEFIKGFGGGGVVKVRTENGSPNVTMDVSISQKADINTEMKPYKDAGGARVTDSPFDGDGENTVSWGINEENANDKNGCIVTLPTRIAHPTATSGETTTEDKSKIRMFFRSFAKSPSGITAAITKEIGYKDIPSTESKPTPSATFGISITPDYSTSSQVYLNMAAWTPPAKMTGDDTAHTPCGWERGKTAWKNGHDVDASHPAVGCSIKVCSHTILRTVTISGTRYQGVEQFFTKLDFDENGLLVRAVPATDWYVIPDTITPI